VHEGNQSKWKSVVVATPHNNYKLLCIIGYCSHICTTAMKECCMSSAPALSAPPPTTHKNEGSAESSQLAKAKLCKTQFLHYSSQQGE